MVPNKTVCRNRARIMSDVVRLNDDL